MDIDTNFTLLYWLGFFGISIIGVRFAGSSLYLVQENCCKKKMKINKYLPPVERPKKRRYTAKKNTIAPEITHLDDPNGQQANSETPRNFMNDDKWDTMNLLKKNANIQGGGINGFGNQRKGTQYNFTEQNITLKPGGVSQVDPLSEINGEYLRAIRRRRNLSIKDVSKMTGIRKYRIKIIENGIDRPTQEEALGIKNGLGENIKV